MAVHRVLAQHEPGRDLAVRESFGDEAEDLDLARREDSIAAERAHRLRRGTEAPEQIASSRCLGDRSDLLEKRESKPRLAYGRVSKAERLKNPRQLEPRPRKLEGRAAHRVEL